MNPLISVIIPTYKRPAYILNLLESLLRQTISVNQFEIFIIDNGLDNDTEAVVRKFSTQYPDNIFYYQQEKRGASATRNLGIAKAQSDIVFFLDDDMSASPQLIAEHLAIHAKHPNEEICVLGFFETEWGSKDDVFLKFLQKSEMQNDFPAATDDEVPFRYFYTGNISCTKSAIKKAGGFDEGFTLYGVEDIDLGYRLATGGIKIYFNKRALSFHNYNPEIEDFLKKREQAGKSLGYFLDKYPHLKENFSFGRFPWIFLGCGRLIFFIANLFIKFNKQKKLTFMLYYYFRVLIRWSMYKNFFLYSWKNKRESRNSLSNLLR